MCGAGQVGSTIGRTKDKVNARLIGDLDPGAWEIPQKPKYIRWATYEALIAKYERAQASLTGQCALALARLIKRG